MFEEILLSMLIRGKWSIVVEEVNERLFNPFQLTYLQNISDAFNWPEDKATFSSKFMGDYNKFNKGNNWMT